jgi:hypothetical protein
MHAIVVYESMFGNTHTIAEHIATGLGSAPDITATALSVHDVTPDLVASAGLLVVGGPTHVHGMTSERTRAGVEDMANKNHLELDPDWEGPGLRDWFDTMTSITNRPAAAFDTRLHGTALLTGQASKGIAKRLDKHGYHLVVEPESFFVDKSSHLEADEAERATAWAHRLALAASAQSSD